MDTIYSCDKNKLGKILKKISILIDETPKESLLRYVFKNKKMYVWEANYLFILSRSGVIKIYDKEIDVDGENVFYLQLLDEQKFYRFKREFVGSNAAIFQDEHSDLMNVIPEDRKNKVVRKMAELLVKINKVDNHLLAKAINPTIQVSIGKRRKFAKKDYNRKKHNPLIENRFVTLKRLWKPLGYTVRQQGSYSELRGL